MEFLIGLVVSVYTFLWENFWEIMKSPYTTNVLLLLIYMNQNNGRDHIHKISTYIQLIYNKLENLRK